MAVVLFSCKPHATSVINIITNLLGNKFLVYSRVCQVYVPYVENMCKTDTEMNICDEFCHIDPTINLLSNLNIIHITLIHSISMFIFNLRFVFKECPAFVCLDILDRCVFTGDLMNDAQIRKKI